MKRNTERDQVRTVAGRWRSVYGECAVRPKDALQIQCALDALDVESASAADVERIIGNGSWVCADICDECGARDWNAVTVRDEDSEYVDSGAALCTACLRKALRMADGGR